MTTYDIKFTDNNIKNTNNGNIYSQILDDIILSTVKKNNSYLFNTKKKDDDLIDAMFNELDHTYIYKRDSLFAEACKILANYGKKKSIMKGIKLGKIYRLDNGLPIIFYNDEIQIGTDIYSYSDFNDYNFISSLSPEIKKTIININIKL
jgi:hypothetical protein